MHSYSEDRIKFESGKKYWCVFWDEDNKDYFWLEKAKLVRRHEETHTTCNYHGDMHTSITYYINHYSGDAIDANYVFPDKRQAKKYIKDTLCETLEYEEKKLIQTSNKLKEIKDKVVKLDNKVKYYKKQLDRIKDL